MFAFSGFAIRQHRTNTLFYVGSLHKVCADKNDNLNFIYLNPQIRDISYFRNIKLFDENMFFEVLWCYLQLLASYFFQIQLIEKYNFKKSTQKRDAL